MALAERSTTNIRALKMRVEGMDCSACALKIDNALKRLPGVSNINVNYGTETLVLNVGRRPHVACDNRREIRKLGYAPQAVAGTAPEATESASQLDLAWWQTRKGQVVIVNAALLATAVVVASIAPGLSFWAYLAATLIGLGPIVRRTLAGALSGTPFSIETLMTVAATGAVVIGAAQEAAVVIFLFAVGELLENAAAGRARAGVKALVGLVPRTAQIEDAGQPRVVPVEELRVGDVAVIRPGDRVPSDGEVMDGFSEVDEAPVTGEAIPVAKNAGVPCLRGQHQWQRSATPAHHQDGCRQYHCPNHSSC